MQCANAFFAKRWAPYALIALLIALVWGHTVKFGFVWDDQQFIQDLQSIRSLKNVPSMFCSLDAQASMGDAFKVFRPLRTVHYAILYQLSGDSAPLPWLYHLSNVLWHMGTAMLLYAVAILLFQHFLPATTERKRQWLALFVAGAFAVHPVISEVVCWAKSLDDAMAAVFTLASMHALLRWNGDGKHYGFAVLLFALAVYSKISAVPFAIVTFLIFHQLQKLPLLRAARLSAPFFAVALVFMVHRHLVIGQSSQTAPLSGTHVQTLVDMLPVVPAYLRLFCGVPPFCIDYSFMKGQYALLSAPVLLGIVLLAIAAGVTWFSYRKADWTLVAFGLLWIGAFLLPVSNVLPMMQYMAERFLYLPLIGWLLLLAVLANRVPRWQLSGSVCAAVVAVWSGVAWDRSFIWRDELTLFITTSQQHPGIRRVEQNAAAAIFQLPHVREMFQLNESTRTLSVVGTIDPEKRSALHQTLQEAQKLLPQEENIASALGILLATSGRPAEAMPYFRIAVERRPKNPLFWANLGQASMDANAWTEAQEAVTKAISLAPTNVTVLRTASRVAMRREDYHSATNLLRTLLQLDPRQAEYAHQLREAEVKLRPPTPTVE
jgi:protein O-mannosyl-transferase